MNPRVYRAPCAAVHVQVWDLKDAGLQAASRVAAASDPLGLLAEISQNFLSLVSSLTRQKVRVVAGHRGGVLVQLPGSLLWSRHGAPP